jgi:hypothetical protein
MFALSANASRGSRSPIALTSWGRRSCWVEPPAAVLADRRFGANRLRAIWTFLSSSGHSTSDRRHSSSLHEVRREEHDPQDGDADHLSSGRLRSARALRPVTATSVDGNPHDRGDVDQHHCVAHDPGIFAEPRGSRQFAGEKGTPVRSRAGRVPCLVRSEPPRTGRPSRRVTLHLMANGSLEAIFAQEIVRRVAPGPGQAVRDVVGDFLPGEARDARGRALQLYPLGERAWTVWVPTALDAVGLDVQAGCARSQPILDPDSALVAAELAREYGSHLVDLPPSPAPAARQSREKAALLLEEANALLTVIAGMLPYPGALSSDQFAIAVRHAAAGLVAFYESGRADLRNEVRNVMSDAAALT